MADVVKYGRCIISLIKLAFGDDGYKCSNFDNIDYDLLLELSSRHNVANICYKGLEQVCDLGVEIPNSALSKFKDVYESSIIRDRVQRYHMGLVSQLFQMNGIYHCVLKGLKIKEYYPESWMRTTGDIDMLVLTCKEPKALSLKMQEHIKSIMVELGFECERFGTSNEDTYVLHDKKCGDIHVDMHRYLVPEEKIGYDACSEIEDRLIQENKQNPYRLVMTNEDFYLMMISHFAKHMAGSGAGIRFLLDVYVFNKQVSVDKELLQERLKNAKLDVFENRVRSAVDVLFYEKTPCDLDKQFIKYVFMSGVFGTREQTANSVYNKFGGENSNKLSIMIRHYFKNFFMPYEYMKAKFPVLEKAPILLPAYWIYRGCYGLADKGKRRAFVGLIEGVELEEAKMIGEFKKAIGI